MRFVSKKKNLRLVLKPTDRIIDDQRRPILLRGVTIEFGNGMYATDDEEIIKTLLNHPLCGNEFVSADNDKRWLDEHPNVSVITGARNTGSISSLNTNNIDRKAPAAQPIDIENIIADKVAVEMERQFSRIESLLSKVLTAAPVSEKVEEPKKTFACPICGEVFLSGFDVGKHKKEAHADVYVSTIDAQ